jgi:hypothetical protein
MFNCRIALLLDADNITHAKIGAIVAELSSCGAANIRSAYGDWTSGTLKGEGQVLPVAIRPMQMFSYSAGKNATDMALVIDASFVSPARFRTYPAGFCPDTALGFDVDFVGAASACGPGPDFSRVSR